MPRPPEIIHTFIRHALHTSNFASSLPSLVALEPLPESLLLLLLRRSTVAVRWLVPSLRNAPPRNCLATDYHAFSSKRRLQAFTNGHLLLTTCLSSPFSPKHTTLPSLAIHCPGASVGDKAPAFPPDAVAALLCSLPGPLPYLLPSDPKPHILRAALSPRLRSLPIHIALLPPVLQLAFPTRTSYSEAS